MPKTQPVSKKCPYCEKTFTRSYVLQNHIRTHTGERPHECSRCGKAFKTRNEWRVHGLEVHDKIKRFQCQHCGRSFGRKGSLNEHTAKGRCRAAQMQCPIVDLTNLPDVSDIPSFVENSHEEAMEIPETIPMQDPSEGETLEAMDGVVPWNRLFQRGEYSPRWYRTAFRIAVKEGKDHPVHTILAARKVDVNTPELFPYGANALHKASRYCHLNVVQALLSFGAEVDAQDSLHRTAIHDCVSWKNPKYTDRIAIIELLLHHGASVNLSTNTRDAPLHVACRSEEYDVVKILLEYGADVTRQSFQRRTPLHDACVSEKWGIVELLLNNGASVNTADDKGNMPLHYAYLGVDSACKHTSDIYAMLIRDSAVMNIVNKNGLTPLCNFVERHRCKVMYELQDKGKRFKEFVDTFAKLVKLEEKYNSFVTWRSNAIQTLHKISVEESKELAKSFEDIEDIEDEPSDFPYREIEKLHLLCSSIQLLRE